MPILTTTYSDSELQKDKCRSCGELSNEILRTDGRCIDCIEEQKFIDATMNHENLDDTDLSFMY